MIETSELNYNQKALLTALEGWENKFNKGIPLEQFRIETGLPPRAVPERVVITEMARVFRRKMSLPTRSGK